MGSSMRKIIVIKGLCVFARCEHFGTATTMTCEHWFIISIIATSIWFDGKLQFNESTEAKRREGKKSRKTAISVV